MKDWIINNPKFFILVVIVVTVIIIFTVVTFIHIGIEASAADSVSTVFKDFSMTFWDMGPKNFPSDDWTKELIWNQRKFPTTFGDMDSRTTKIIWNPERSLEKP